MCFSRMDAAILGAAVAATWILWQAEPLLAPVPAIAVGHFFVFCNVFRVRRRLELAWAGCLLVNAAAWFLAGAFSWVSVLAVQTPLTAGLVALEMCTPRYHGVLARAINPCLDAYLRGEV
jgi:hypothetical protein